MARIVPILRPQFLAAPWCHSLETFAYFVVFPPEWTREQHRLV
jgi:hypothetical protein